MNQTVTELKDIFTFINEYNLTFDITSEWFQDLWYPLSKSMPSLEGGHDKVKNQPIIITQNLLEWMGYKGRDLSDKQGRFSKALRSFEISYYEIGYNHPFATEYPCVQREVKSIAKKNNRERKRWICMEQRAFKKAVLRLNTENAEIVSTTKTKLTSSIKSWMCSLATLTDTIFDLLSHLHIKVHLLL